MMHPAVSLTLTLFMTLMIGMPLVGLFVSRRQKTDPNARIWFLAVVLDSLQIPLVALRAQSESWWTMVLPGAIPIMFYMTLIEVIRREQGICVERPWWRVTHAGVFYLCIQSLVYAAMTDSEFTIGLINNFLFVVFAGALTYQTFILATRSRSRGMWFVSLGFLVSMLGYSVRAWRHVIDGVATPVFGFGAYSNFQIWTVAINLILMTFGYLGYVLERSEAKRLRLATEAAEAEARERTADQYNQQLLQTIEERDHMVMVNSRFLNLSALAVFNSAIVHEISQPLQAAMMALDNLQAEDEAHGGQLADEIHESVAMVNKAGEIVGVLRNMMRQGSGQDELVDVVGALCAVMPIVRGDARSRGVTLDNRIPDVVLPVVCQGVMLQRLFLNLVANAFDAFSAAKTTAPKLCVSCEPKDDPFHPGCNGVLICVNDNGPGMPAQQLSQLFKPFDSKKTDGLGIGLSIAQIMLNKWGGRIDASINNEGGMCFKIWLPQAKV